MLTRKWIASPNYSSRGGSAVRLIVIHTAEGALTIEALGSFFSSSSSGVSSHTGIDDKPGVIGEYVKRGNKAWTASNANPVAVQTELCAFAKWSGAEWNKHPAMLDNCAKWIAEEAAQFDLPIVKLTPAQAQGSGRGVCQHNDLGAWGGGHWDCGSGFPIDSVIAAAQGYARGEGGNDEMGYPEWYWQWSNWYLTTNRDPKTRPANAPQQIPDWAWQANEQQLRLLNRYGMTDGERQWLDWYLGGKEGPRPNVPQTIPDRWWPDQAYVAGRS